MSFDRSADRRRKVEEIFHAVLKLDADTRETFLSSACAADASLRSEVEGLIAANERTGGFLDSPAYEIVAGLIENQSPVLIGKAIGHYEIGELIGRGGMGEVYRARDARLNRTVAVKFLSSNFADESGRRRFQQEARTASALNFTSGGRSFQTVSPSKSLRERRKKRVSRSRRTDDRL